MSPITTLTTKMLPSKSPTLKLILFSRSRECLTRYSHRVTHSQKCSSVMSHHSTIILKLRLKREDGSGFLVRDHIKMIDHIKWTRMGWKGREMDVQGVRIKNDGPYRMTGHFNEPSDHWQNGSNRKWDSTRFYRLRNNQNRINKFIFRIAWARIDISLIWKKNNNVQKIPDPPM